MINRLTSYLRESHRELKRVNWPTPRETYRLTTIVVVLSLLVAAFLGVLDFAFGEILKAVFL